MFGPDYQAGLPVLLGDRGRLRRLRRPPRESRRQLLRVSRAPFAKLQAYKERMGWSFPWASSFDSDFNYDFQASHTKEEWEPGAVEYNFRTLGPPAGDRREGLRPRRVRSGSRRNGLGDVQARRPRRERVRARGRRRLPHLLGVRARPGRPLGHVPVARPHAARPQRDRASGGAATTSTSRRDVASELDPEQMITVRSIGSLKYSAASAVRREVARKRLFRHLLRPGASPRWRSIVERK